MHKLHLINFPGNSLFDPFGSDSVLILYCSRFVSSLYHFFLKNDLLSFGELRYKRMSKSPEKISAWNPNGIRSLFEKYPSEVQRFCKTYNPDIIIWNEIKGNLWKHLEIEKTVKNILPNYNWIWNHADKPGRHGLAISIKPEIKILNIDYGFGDGLKEVEGRLITLELEQFFVVGLYAVNAGVKELARLNYKIEWINKLLNYMNNLRSKGKHVIVMGDWNIAPTSLDVHNPKRLEGCAGFTKEERQLFKNLESNNWIDVFRYKHPDAKEFSFYSGRTKEGKKYGGWRIDHAIVDSGLNLDFCRFKILKEYNGSDHVPIFFHISDKPIIEKINPPKLQIIPRAKLEIVKIK